VKIDATVERAADSRTRDEVARLLLEQGPATAASLGSRLGLSPAAVRRHLDALAADGLIEVRHRRPLGPRGRGRPAKLFALTETGRESFPHAYDDLATAALRYLADTFGPDAVTAFAENRLAPLEERNRDAVAAAGDPTQRLEALATVLTEEGYAASVGPQPGAALPVVSGGQLCQHHCPVAHVAAEFPQLCEAETRAFARMLGTHVQRLATIARGDGICTTHVPAAGRPTAVPPSTTPTPVTGRKSG
jgi:predicted ArsR family transcriptional regulator